MRRLRELRRLNALRRRQILRRLRELRRLNALRRRLSRTSTPPSDVFRRNANVRGGRRDVFRRVPAIRIARFARGARSQRLSVARFRRPISRILRRIGRDFQTRFRADRLDGDQLAVRRLNPTRFRRRVLAALPLLTDALRVETGATRADQPRFFGGVQRKRRRQSRRFAFAVFPVRAILRGPLSLHNSLSLRRLFVLRRQFVLRYLLVLRRQFVLRRLLVLRRQFVLRRLLVLRALLDRFNPFAFRVLKSGRVLPTRSFGVGDRANFDARLVPNVVRRRVRNVFFRVFRSDFRRVVRRRVRAAVAFAALRRRLSRQRQRAQNARRDDRPKRRATQRDATRFRSTTTLGALAFRVADADGTKSIQFPLALPFATPFDASPQRSRRDAKYDQNRRKDA